MANGPGQQEGERDGNRKRPRTTPQQPLQQAQKEHKNGGPPKKVKTGPISKRALGYILLEGKTSSNAPPESPAPLCPMKVETMKALEIYLHKAQIDLVDFARIVPMNEHTLSKWFSGNCNAAEQLELTKSLSNYMAKPYLAQQRAFLVQQVQRRIEILTKPKDLKNKSFLGLFAQLRQTFADSISAPKRSTSSEDAASHEKEKKSPKPKVKTDKKLSEKELYDEAMKLCYAYDQRGVWKRTMDIYMRVHGTVSSGLFKLLHTAELNILEATAWGAPLRSFLLLTVIICGELLRLYKFNAEFPFKLFQRLCFCWRKVLLGLSTSPDALISTRIVGAPDESNTPWKTVEQVLLDLDLCLNFVESNAATMRWAPAKFDSVAGPVRSWLLYFLGQ